MSPGGLCLCACCKLSHCQLGFQAENTAASSQTVCCNPATLRPRGYQHAACQCPKVESVAADGCQSVLKLSDLHHETNIGSSADLRIHSRTRSKCPEQQHDLLDAGCVSLLTPSPTAASSLSRLHQMCSCQLVVSMHESSQAWLVVLTQ